MATTIVRVDGSVIADRRAIKKHDNQGCSHLQQAYYRGQDAYYRDLSGSFKPARNPYPKGRRHDEWDRGYASIDRQATYWKEH